MSVIVTVYLDASNFINKIANKDDKNINKSANSRYLNKNYTNISV